MGESYMAQGGIFLLAPNHTGNPNTKAHASASEVNSLEIQGEEPSEGMDS